MGEVSRRSVKPLQVNPVRLTQPLGATLAFLGVENDERFAGELREIVRALASGKSQGANT